MEPQSNHSAIPKKLSKIKALKDLPNPNAFVIWNEETRNGKPCKRPYDPKTGKPARVNDATSWGTLEEAMEARDDAAADGIGYVVTKPDKITFIDIDGCVNPETGEITTKAQNIIQQLDSYTEYSPSGTGVHILAFGSLPDGTNGRKNDRVEMYDDARFFTLTGDQILGTPSQIMRRQKALLNVHNAAFKHNGNPPQSIGGQLQPIPQSFDELPRSFKELYKKNAEVRRRCNRTSSHVIDRSDSGWDYSLLRKYLQRCPSATDDELIKVARFYRRKYTPNDSKIDRADYWQQTVEAVREKMKDGKAHDETDEWKIYNIGERGSQEPVQKEFDVEGMIPKATIGTLAGYPKDGKSFLALDLAVHLATASKKSLPWLGRFKCKRRRVFYLSRQDEKTLVDLRFDEICKGYNLPQVEDGYLMAVYRPRFSLVRRNHVDWLKRVIRDHRFDFLILDVFYTMISGLDQNSGADMAKVVDVLEEINRELGITILILDHTKKPQGKNQSRDGQEPNPFNIAGSIAKYGMDDFVLCLVKTVQEHRQRLSAETKYKDLKHDFLIDRSPEDSGEPKFSFAGDIQNLKENSATQRITSEKRVFNSLTSKWRTPKDIESRTGLSKTTVWRCLQSLISQERIEHQNDKYRRAVSPV